MIEIDTTIISRDILERHFVCHLSECKGMCCYYGNSGAPLEDDELEILTEIYPTVKPHMSPEGIDIVEQQGVYVIDFDDEKVTPLVGDEEECAYAVKDDNNVFHCAIEKAYINGEISFRKPLSCNLFPIRITKYKDFDAVNFQHWRACDDALLLGQQKNIPLYVFLKEPLIRKYGEQWYEQLCKAAAELE